jgi:hypothetical protein
MKSVKTVTKIVERIRFGVGNSIISVSTNNATYTNIGTLSFAWGNWNKQELVLETPVEARYMRIQITANWPATDSPCWNTYLSISRLWVYGSNNGE